MLIHSSTASVVDGLNQRWLPSSPVAVTGGRPQWAQSTNAGAYPAIASARRTLYVTNSYFVPDRDIRALLVGAAPSGGLATTFLMSGRILAAVSTPGKRAGLPVKSCQCVRLFNELRVPVSPSTPASPAPSRRAFSKPGTALFRNRAIRKA